MPNANSDPQSPFRLSFARRDSREARDRRWLHTALVFAILIHLGALFLPMPLPKPSSPPEPQPIPPRIVPVKLLPPEIPERPRREIVTRERRAPIPMPSPVDHLDPLSEARFPLVDLDSADADFILVPEPPPAVGPMSEETAGLVRPVPFPDRRRPEYPEVARQARLEGRVKLKAVVDEYGRVRSIRVLEAPRVDAGFSQAAVEAVSEWLYEPGRYRGSAVAVEITVIVDFLLQ